MQIDEITFEIERDEASGHFAASWDAPDGKGGIATQGKDLRELEEMIHDAVRCYFDEGKLPRSIRLHFVRDPILATA